MWILPSLVASASAVSLEYVFRARLFSSYLSGWWLFVPAGLIIQAMLFYSYRDAPKFLVAWSVFFVVNIAGRIILSTVLLHEVFAPSMGIGLLLVVVGAVLIRL